MFQELFERTARLLKASVMTYSSRTDDLNPEAPKCYALIVQGADKSLARPTSRCILFDGENISFDASLVIYIYI